MPSAARALQDLAATGSVRLRVAGRCMEPALATGDVVSVRSASFYWPGDLLAYRASSGALVVHRLIGYRPGLRGLRLWTQADSSSAPDSAFGSERVLGRVVARVPWGARARSAARLGRHLARRLLAALP